MLRAYVAYARRFQPEIPNELTEYIVNMYVQMRLHESKAGENAMVKFFFYFYSFYWTHLK